jgi:hypothetical protein
MAQRKTPELLSQDAKSYGFRQHGQELRVVYISSSPLQETCVFGRAERACGSGTTALSK